MVYIHICSLLSDAVFEFIQHAMSKFVNHDLGGGGESH